SHVGLSGLLGMTVVFDGFRADFAATNYQITMSLRGAKRRGNPLPLHPKDAVAPQGRQFKFSRVR
ncbi:MAG: hypothetical protein IKT52_07385, partial [Oscillospiraceae bacterium]|nr:hypothetical protein [Oscillospiraceae bacterium]